MRHHYRVDPNLGKVVCAILRIPCACPAYVAQLNKNWLPNGDPSSQSRYAHVENCYYNKVLEYYNNWTIIEFLHKNTPKVELNNKHSLIVEVMLTNKA